MAALTIPSSGLVCLDTSPLIYSVEHHPVYAPFLRPLWLAAQAATVQIAEDFGSVGRKPSGNTSHKHQYTDPCWLERDS